MTKTEFQKAIDVTINLVKTLNKLNDEFCIAMPDWTEMEVSEPKALDELDLVEVKDNLVKVTSKQVDDTFWKFRELQTALLDTAAGLKKLELYYFLTL